MPEESEIRILLEKSELRILAARKLLESGFYDDAIGRAYYAMYFAVKAMLLRKNIAVKTHRGLISAFGSAYVQTGIVEAEFGRMLSIAEELREEIDYSVVRTITREEARAVIDDAEHFLARMKVVLTE